MEAPITPTCRHGLAALLVTAALATGAPAAANVTEWEQLRTFAEARAADGIGAGDRAARGYSDALAASPDNEVLAGRAFVEAVSIGDKALALRAAHILERKGNLTPDVRLFLLGDALADKDWAAANAHADAIGKDQIFGFVAPVVRAWIAYGSRKGDPVAIIDATGTDRLAAGYAAEQKALLLLALGKEKEGLPQLIAAAETAEAREARLRIAGAAILARHGERDDAKALLQGEAPPIVAARRLVEQRKAIPGAVDTPAAALAELLVRLSLDLNSQNVTELALSFARVSTFLAPDNSETWLATSELLTAGGQHSDAIRVLANIGSNDPFFGTVPDRRIRLLAASGNKERALAEAEAAVHEPGADVSDWTRLGDLLVDLGRQVDAAGAYSKAIELARKGDQSQPEWTLWLLRGGALEQADKWPEAKDALENAYKLAPNQPLVLNYLGYAQLERNENVAEAMRLIEEASRLQPDSAEITDSLGWAHYLRGDVPAAIPLLERAASAKPVDVDINEHLGDAYYSAGRHYEARYAWAAALLNAEGKQAARLREKIDQGLTPQLASR